MTTVFERIPWWVVSLLGLVGAGLGVVLIFNPFDSIDVLRVVVAIGLWITGPTALAAARTSAPRWPARLGGFLWIVAGVLVIAWPDITTRALAVIVGVSLIVGGLLDMMAGISGSTDERLAAIIGGASSIVFGLLALGWPSITVLVVAIVFGARLVLHGLRLAWSSFRERNAPAGARRADDEASEPPGRLRRAWNVVGAAIGLVIALLLAGVSNRLNEGEPKLDAFYDAPSDLPAEPGSLLRAESFTRTIPDNAVAWRILYTTTRADGEPAVASAIVVAPKEPSDEPRPLIALAHGTTGVDRTCAPSALKDPFAAGAFFALDQVIDRGWALVATDYVGLGTKGGHPYLVGEPEGRSVLDSVRAARQLAELNLSDQTVVWGHSQGGGAALWTGVLSSTYAPDAGVIGVAALAPASDLVGLVKNLGNVPGGSIFAAYVVQGYANAYDDVQLGDYVRSAARSSFDAAVGRCLAEPQALLSVIGAVTLGNEIFSTDLASGPLLARFEENVPTGPIDVPLLLAQGEADSLVLPSVQADYVAARCAAGQPIDFRTYPGLDHVPLVEADSPLIPELFAWTEARLAGEEPTPTCGT